MLNKHIFMELLLPRIDVLSIKGVILNNAKPPIKILFIDFVICNKPLTFHVEHEESIQMIINNRVNLKFPVNSSHLFVHYH